MKQRFFTVTWPLYCPGTGKSPVFIPAEDGGRVLPLFTDLDLLDRFAARHPVVRGAYVFADHARLADFVADVADAVTLFAFDPAPPRLSVGPIGRLREWAAANAGKPQPDDAR